MRISHSRIKRRLIIVSALTLLISGLPGAFVRAYVPSVAELDATARAAGNRLDVATMVGKSVFAIPWRLQVSQISANEVGTHLILGIRVWGVKFHEPMTRSDFSREVASLIRLALAAAPKAEEVDFWASVPLAVGKGVIVSGDLAKPTTRTVYSLSVRRSESASSILARTWKSGAGAFWDQDWASTAFKSAKTS